MEPVEVIEPGCKLNTIAISPDGKLLAAGNDQGEVIDKPIHFSWYYYHSQPTQCWESTLAIHRESQRSAGQAIRNRYSPPDTMAAFAYGMCTYEIYYIYIYIYILKGLIACPIVIVTTIMTLMIVISSDSSSKP